MRRRGSSEAGGGMGKKVGSKDEQSKIIYMYEMSQCNLLLHMLPSFLNGEQRKFGGMVEDDI